jgi:hypothetical protein
MIPRKEQMTICHIKGMVEIYHHSQPGVIFVYHTYYWCVMGQNALTGPFDSKEAALINYEANLQAIKSVQLPAITDKKVVHVDFVLKRRLSI